MGSWEILSERGSHTVGWYIETTRVFSICLLFWYHQESMQLEACGIFEDGRQSRVRSVSECGKLSTLCPHIGPAVEKRFTGIGTRTYVCSLNPYTAREFREAMGHHSVVGDTKEIQTRSPQKTGM